VKKFKQPAQLDKPDMPDKPLAMVGLTIKVSM
jgi:hypothetical protein